MSPIILLADKNIIGVHNDPKDYYLYISLVLSFFIYFFIILGYIRGGKNESIDKSYAKGKKMRTDKNMEQIALRALF